jgi:hypothetical protein
MFALDMISRCPKRIDHLPAPTRGRRATLLSTARENAKEHKHDNDNDDDPQDSADRKKHSERRKHSRLQVRVSVSSLLVGLRNESSRRALVARLRRKT